MVVCDTLPAAVGASPSTVKVFVHAHPDGTQTSFLRIGASSPSTVWPIDTSTIKIVREPHVTSLAGRVFAHATNTTLTVPVAGKQFTIVSKGERVACDATGGLFKYAGSFPLLRHATN